jgi:hypothetical protein
MATERGLYSTISTTHNGYCNKQIARHFETVQSSPCPIHSHAEISNTEHMPYSSKSFQQNNE